MLFACGIWCLADVSSVSPSSEQTANTSSAPSLPVRTSSVDVRFIVLFADVFISFHCNINCIALVIL